jgi:hypothetical protein
MRMCRKQREVSDSSGSEVLEYMPLSQRRSRRAGRVEVESLGLSHRHDDAG